MDGFFLLSGLILARVHPELAISPAGAARFWGKRLARIYPVHLAVIILLAVIVATGLCFGMTPRDPGRFSLAALLQNLVLIQGWGFGGQLAWNYPSWSVSTEWAGYLLFPIFWFCIARWTNIVAAQIIILCLPILGLVEYLSGHGPQPHFCRFFMAVLPGIHRRHRHRQGHPRDRRLHAKPGACRHRDLAWCFYSCSSTLIPLWSPDSGLAITAFAMQADAERSPVLPQYSFLRFLGVLSYAFYMSFATIELLLAQLFRHEGWDPANSKLIYSAR